MPSKRSTTDRYGDHIRVAPKNVSVISPEDLEIAGILRQRMAEGKQQLELWLRWLNHITTPEGISYELIAVLRATDKTRLQQLLDCFRLWHEVDIEVHITEFTLRSAD